mmetsp:Transcript_26941/g.65428  ORF Transcript_26941/g.65428 Transcript_26941/m.65428 type:complete len:293 (+) Transcript_26941:950-1828(+)
MAAHHRRLRAHHEGKQRGCHPSCQGCRHVVRGRGGRQGAAQGPAARRRGGRPCEDPEPQGVPEGRGVCPRRRDQGDGRNADPAPDIRPNVEEHRAVLRPAARGPAGQEAGDRGDPEEPRDDPDAPGRRGAPQGRPGLHRGGRRGEDALEERGPAHLLRREPCARADRGGAWGVLHVSGTGRVRGAPPQLRAASGDHARDRTVRAALVVHIRRVRHAEVGGFGLPAGRVCPRRPPHQDRAREPADCQGDGPRPGAAGGQVCGDGRAQERGQELAGGRRPPRSRGDRPEAPRAP